MGLVCCSFSHIMDMLRFSYKRIMAEEEEMILFFSGFVAAYLLLGLIVYIGERLERKDRRNCGY